MPTQEMLNQAQTILELQEENRNLKQYIRSCQRAAQDKEGYIHDLMGAHQKLIKAIEETCIQAGEDEAGLADDIEHHIEFPPTSVADEREARLAVFKKPNNDYDVEAQ